MSAITIRLHRAFLDALNDDVVVHGDLARKPLDLDLALPLPQHLRLYLYSLVVEARAARPSLKQCSGCRGRSLASTGRSTIPVIDLLYWPHTAMTSMCSYCGTLASTNVLSMAGTCRLKTPSLPKPPQLVGRGTASPPAIRHHRDRFRMPVEFSAARDLLPRQLDRRNDDVTGLATLALKTSYHKGRDDIASDFYLPAMRCATKYDRAVGYFRSTVFIIAWPALREFVARGGRIRILCSQVLSADDIEAIDAGYTARVDETIAARIHDEVDMLLKDETMAEPARVLGALVATEVIDFRIAILRPMLGNITTRIFHDKLGILHDAQGSVLIFKGSMNETWSGLAEDGNLESVDVACSWLGGRDQRRTIEETAYFQDLWTNTYPGLDVRPFPDIARETLVSAADSDWESTVERLLRQHAYTGSHRPR